MNFIDLFGIIPAIIFPAASVVQLIHLIRVKDSRGASVLSWGFFVLGNVSLFVYTKKYTAWQSIIGLLGTAVLQIGIMVLIIRYRKKETTSV